jgi:O-antigen/teichoic acid export membrane protein
MSELIIEIQRHGTMYLISSLGITLAGFFATIFYAHWVGADILGEYFLFLSYFSISCLITDFGIGYAGTKRICEGKDPNRFFTTSLVLRIGIYILLVIGLITFQDRFVDLKQAGLFWLLIIVVGISILQSTAGMAISASNRLGLAASTTLINNIVRIIFQVIAVFLGFQVYGLVGGLIAGILLELVIQLKFIDYHLERFGWSHIRSIFSFSGWVFLTTTGTVLFDYANLIIIGYFLPVSDVGIFGVCWTFSFLALFVSTALCNTLYVKVSRWNIAGDRDTISTSLSRATTYALIFALPILAGGIILGERLLYYLYGASFAVGATALVIIIAARVFQSIYQLYSNYLMATDHVRMAFYGVGAGITINIALSILLVPILGITGAALASLANMLISTIICRHFLRQGIQIIVERSPITHIITATALMTIVLLIINLFPNSQSLFITVTMVLVGAVIYFAVLLKLDTSIREDVFRLLKITWIA